MACCPKESKNNDEVALYFQQDFKILEAFHSHHDSLSKSVKTSHSSVFFSVPQNVGLDTGFGWAKVPGLSVEKLHYYESHRALTVISENEACGHINLLLHLNWTSVIVFFFLFFFF